MNPVYEKLMRCLNSVKEKVDFVPEIALVLGSGLGDYADQMRLPRRWTTAISRVFRYLPPRGTRAVLSSAM